MPPMPDPLSTSANNDATDRRRRGTWHWPESPGHREIWCYAVLFLLTVAVYWKIVLTSQFTWLDSPDLAVQVVPWLREQVRQLKTLHFPVWDARHWAGYSFAGQGQPGVLFPLNWLLALFPLQNDHLRLDVLNWYFVIIHYLGACFCFRFLRDLKCSRPASILGSCSFALSGWMGNTGWPQMINGQILAPIVYLYIFRALARDRSILNAGLSGAAVGVAMWSGHHQLPAFTGLSAIVVMMDLASYYKSQALHFLKVLTTFGIFALLVGAPHILSSREFYMRALRWVGSENPVTWQDKVPYVVFSQFSLQPTQIIGFLIPYGYGNVSPYVGVVIVMLAVTACYSRWDHFAVRSMAVVAIAALVYAMGTHTLFQGVLYALIPTLDKSRNVAFAVAVAQIAIATLAAMGCDALVEASEMRERFQRWLFLVPATGAALLFCLLLVRSTPQPDQTSRDVPVAIAACAAAACAVIIYSWHRGHLSKITALSSLLLVFFFEIGSVTGQNYIHQEQKWGFIGKLYQHDDIAGFIRKHIGQGRIATEQPAVGYNFGDWHGVDEFWGSASMTTDIFRLAFHKNTTKLLGVKYRIGSKPHDSSLQNPVFESPAGLKVFEEPDAFPRAWSVHSAVSVRAEELGGRMDVPVPQLRRETYVVGAVPSLETCAGDDQVTVSRLGTTRHIVDVQMSCRGLIVLANGWFPGWRAKADGVSATVYEAYGFLQGVAVDRGNHRIEFVYWPDALLFGCGLLIAGIAGLFVIARFTTW